MFGAIVRGQHVQVGHEEKTLVGILQLRPRFQRPNEVTDVTRPGGAMTGEDAWFFHDWLLLQG